MRRLTGIDRAVGFTVLARGWSSFAGLITLVLISRHLSLAEQGYYYAFYSLVALQIVFELGFSTVVLQMAAHEAAHLRFSASGEISGDTVLQQRLASVLQRSMRWYGIAGRLMLAILLPAGILFFQANPQPGVPVHWLLPWCFAVLASTLTFQIDPLFSFLEGCGYVPQVARTRLWQIFFGSLLAWTALITGHGLFAPAMMVLGQALAGFGWLATRVSFLMPLIKLPCRENRIHWNEIWPFQWRIAVSWICGYFIFSLFNPVMFKYWGAAAAGQMGMSLAIANGISSITIGWINTKAAPFGQMIARKQYAQLDQIFLRTLIQAVCLCAFGCAIVFLANVYLYYHHFPFAKRLLPPLPFGLLLCTPVITQIVASEALYLRAHKQEKFLWNSVIGAACITISSIYLGKHYGALGINAGYLVIALTIGLGGGTWTFMKYRRLWHLQA